MSKEKIVSVLKIFAIIQLFHSIGCASDLISEEMNFRITWMNPLKNL